MTERYDPEIVMNFERETWSRCAEGYGETFAGITRETLPLLLAAGKIGPGSRVLEIGSGAGDIAYQLSEAGAQVTGVDFSARMVEVATRCYPDMIFRQADAEQLPFEDNSFDVVVANFVVHHLARPEVVFREVRRVLKPRSRFVFVVWGAPEDQSSMGAFFGAVAAHHDLEDLPHGPLFGITERSVYEPMLAQAGLGDCQLSFHDVSWRTASLDPILQGFWDWGNMAQLPADTQQKITATTRENARPFEKDGGYVFPHTVLLGCALKLS